MEAVGYVRVSDKKQATEDRTSMAHQRRSISARAARDGATPPKFFEDGGASGKTSDRKGFTALRAYCKANPQPESATGNVYVLNASRYGRFKDTDEFAARRFELKGYGWIVRYVEGDIEGPGAAVVRAANDDGASQYLKTLRPQWIAGLRHQREAGNWCGPEPVGYRRMSTRTGKVFAKGEHKQGNDCSKLTPDPVESKIVRDDIFGLFLSTPGATACGIAEVVHARHPGYRKWSGRTIGKILTNPVYVGDIVSGGEVCAADAHEAIIDRATFAAVQKKLAGNARAPRSVNGGYLLSGILRCSQCGGPYVSAGASRPGGPKGYRCSASNTRRPGCVVCPGGKGTIQQRMIEDVVVQKIADTIADPASWLMIHEAIDATIAKLGQGGDARPQVEAEIKRLEEQRARLVRSVALGTMTDDEAAPVLGPIRAALADAKLRLTKVERAGASLPALRRERDEVLATVHRFRETTKGASAAQLREVVTPWLAGCTFDIRDRSLTLTVRLVPAGFGGCGLEEGDALAAVGFSGTAPGPRAAKPHTAAPLPFGASTVRRHGDHVVIRTSLQTAAAKSAADRRARTRGVA